MAEQPRKRLRCAVYTRKSTEDGLEQDFNSLDAQREACTAYVASQRHEGWEAVPDLYDDGGFSGGTMERPALKQLLGEIEAGRVDIIVVYKVDRLTRSLADFARIVDILDRKGASFVSVTQSFNTTSSMGRLTLNVLLSFAQFEREVTGERIRDKIAASKARGMWMGGPAPLGYDVSERRLVVNEGEAQVVRHLFIRYAELGSIGTLIDELAIQGYRTKLRTYRDGRIVGGVAFGKGMLAALLKNRLYAGEVVHGDKCYPGQHDAIISPELFDRVQAMFAMNRRERLEGKRTKHPSLLTGLLTDPDGRTMGPVSTAKGSRRYRYYVSRTEPGSDQSEVARVAAGPIEQLVTTMIDRHLCRSVSASELISPPSPSNPAWFPAIDQRRKLLGVRAHIQVLRDRVVVTLAGDPSTDDGSDIQLEEPAKLITSGPEMKRAIAPDARSSQGNLDPALLRLIAHAFAARRKLVEGKVEPTINGYSDEHVSKLVRLSWLAPDIISAILDGHQTAGLNGRRLLRTCDLPLAWSAQRRALGFA
ncbi:MAG: recombinase family protein [Chloroflexota bacterium]|nr:recombinase family protein [Chloroflexota bacterium]